MLNLTRQIFLHVVAVCISLIMLSTTAMPQEIARRENARQEAALLWEQMVNVRGGRERLHSISNLLLTMGKTTPDDTHIQLYAYPNKFWEWDKEKAFYDTMWLKMANLDQRKYIVVSNAGIARFDENVSDLQTASYREGYLMRACEFLLETKWLQPTPIRVSRQKLGKRTVDVIETRFTTLVKYRDWRLDYYIDPESLVVLGVARYGSKPKYWEFTSFGGYTTVDGIQVPISFDVDDEYREPKKGNFTPLKFEFNVAYDEGLFERIPTLQAGADAWKPKERSNPRQ